MIERYEPTTGEFSVLLVSPWQTKVYHSWGPNYTDRTACGWPPSRDIPYYLLDPARLQPCRKCFKPTNEGEPTK